MPSSLRAVIDLFTHELATIAFPGVDAAVLQRHADDARAQAAEVERIRRDLEAATAVLDDRLQALTTVAMRGVAYARIYAADQPALSARLAELDSQPSSTAAASEDRPPTRRGRKPAPRPELFDRADDSAGGAEASA